MTRYLLLITILFFVMPASSQRGNIHIIVPLCDNKNQKIVPVPAKIGNGEDPRNNLYWGCKYGIKTFFMGKTGWKLLKCISDPSPDICERLIFTRPGSTIFLIADAYRGSRISEAISEFLNYASGTKKYLSGWIR